MDAVVPFPLESLRNQIDRGPLLIREPLTFRRGFLIESALHRQARLGCGGRNPRDHDLMRHQGLPAPVLREERAQPMLDFVPFTRPRWQMTDLDRPRSLSGQFLQCALPQPQPIPVTATPSGKDQERGRLGIAGPPHCRPPRAERVDGTRGRIMPEAATHPRLLLRQIQDPVGHRLGDVLVADIIDVNAFRILLGPQLAAPVFLAPNSLLLCGGDRKSRTAGFQVSASLLVAVFALRMAIRVLGAFSPLLMTL